MMAAEECDESSESKCANPDCKIASGGRCLEGFAEASGCPQYGKTLVIVPSKVEHSQRQTANGLSLLDAEALSIREAALFLRKGPSNVISLVGPFDSGKTSLIAGIYDLLQRGPVGGYAFAGSTTMHSFERACHDSRRESGRTEPHMERTERGEVLFFHIDLVDTKTKCKAKHAALFGNRAGEDYYIAHDDPDRAKAYPELQRADVLTVLVDGAKLLDSGERHQVRAQVRMTIGAFIEAGVVPAWQRLAIVLTKLDVFQEADPAHENALQFFERLVENVRNDYASKFAEVQKFVVAASPKTSNARRGEGMAELLQYWMSQPYRNVPPSTKITDVTKERSFGKLPLIHIEGGVL